MAEQNINDNNLKTKVCQYRNGKRDFSISELNDIKLYLLTLKDRLTNTAFFKGVIKDNDVVSCFGDAQYDELFDYMFKKHQAAIGIIVIINEQRVLIRKNESICSIDICTLARLLCDGDCIKQNTNLAIGSLTEKFIKFTKTLNQC